MPFAAACSPTFGAAGPASVALAPVSATAGATPSVATACATSIAAAPVSPSVSAASISTAIPAACGTALTAAADRLPDLGRLGARRLQGGQHGGRVHHQRQRHA